MQATKSLLQPRKLLKRPRRVLEEPERSKTTTKMTTIMIITCKLF